MNDRLKDYVDNVFAPHEGTKSISELVAKYFTPRLPDANQGENEEDP